MRDYGYFVGREEVVVGGDGRNGGEGKVFCSKRTVGMEKMGRGRKGGGGGEGGRW